MPKVPQHPDPVRLASLAPEIRVLKAGTDLWRVYFRGGRHPVRWNQFRSVGPLDAARFDHHDPESDPDANPESDPGCEKAVMYLALNPVTCLAEVFQKTRTIHRQDRVPWLVGFPLQADIRLLDLTSSFATRAGASMGLMTGPRSTSRHWARGFHACYPDIEGILYSSSMHGHQPAVVLNERAKAKKPLPASPGPHRALNDTALLAVIKNAGRELGYAVR